MEGKSVSVDRDSTEAIDRTELYERVPERLPRFVVRRLDDETLVRLADGDALEWTERV